MSNRKIEVGNLKMDVDEHITYLTDEEVSMNIREFNILYKRLAYLKKAFTPTKLMDEFWDVE